MNQWSGFATALLAFFVLHSLPVHPAVKARIVSLIGMRLVDRRTRRRLGATEFETLLAAMRQAPLLPGFAEDGDLIRTTTGIGLFVALVLLHPLIIGVSLLAVLY